MGTGFDLGFENFARDYSCWRKYAKSQSMFSTLLETFWQFLIDEFDLAVVETAIEHYFRKTKWLKYD